MAMQVTPEDPRMPNFTLVRSPYTQIPALLKVRFPAFEISEAYLQHGGLMDDLPGVILASFARYLMELSERLESEDEIRNGFCLIDEMLTWGDGPTETSIRDELFHVLEAKPRGLAHALPMMPLSVRLAFETWWAEPY